MQNGKRFFQGRDQKRTCTVIDTGFCLHNSLEKFVAGQTIGKVFFLQSAYTGKDLFRRPCKVREERKSLSYTSRSVR